MDIKNIDKFEGGVSPRKGRVLISEPYLNDPNFERSVVFLGEHNEEGSYGLVLNKPIQNIELKDVVEDIDSDIIYDLYLGGPVEPDILQFLHKNPDFPGAVQISDDIYIGGEFEHLISLINHKALKPEDVKFFLGYSGWEENQLEEEIEQNAWIATDLSADIIFELNPDNLWRRVLREMGGKFKFLSNLPEDPRLN